MEFVMTGHKLGSELRSGVPGMTRWVGRRRRYYSAAAAAG
jgi:hypothetical protein